MKRFLVIAAVLGLSSSAALAECAGHVTASATVDKTITTASIAASASEVRSDEGVVLKQSSADERATATE